MFGIAVMTVSDTISKVYENPESGNPYTPNETTAIPLASTERGTDTLVAGGIDLSDYAQLLDSSDNEDESDMPFSLDDDWSNMESDVPFNLEADAGFTAEQPTNTVSKPSEYDKVQEAKVNPTQLQEKYVELMDKVEFLGKQITGLSADPSKFMMMAKTLTLTGEEMLQIQRIAAQSGISLPN